MKQHFYARNTFYNSYWITKFLNKFMRDGKKIIVEKHIHKAFKNFKMTAKAHPTPILLKGICILKPILNITDFLRLRGAKKKQAMAIPVPISNIRQLKLALTWMVKLIQEQKRTRRQHNSSPSVKKQKRGISKLSKSKTKTFYDRFHIALKNQNLTKLVENQLSDFLKNSHQILYKKKLTFYISAANARTNCPYRWV